MKAAVCLDLILQKKTVIYCWGLLLTLLATPTLAEVSYVDDDATPGGDGTSWETAFQNLQDAVDAADADNGGEVWIAQGVYTGTGDYAIEMAENVHLYGGFLGNETVRDQRNWEVYQTTIDGELTRCCVLGADHATLDGFYLENGMGVMQEGDVFIGSGMMNINCSPTVTNCTFTNHQGRLDDIIGVMHNRSSSPTVTGCIFKDNEPSGIYNMDFSFPIVTDCLFTNNQDSGIHNSNSAPRVRRCVFSGNSALYHGGGMYNRYSSPIVLDCSFERNSASFSGGMGNYYSSPVIDRCSFIQNYSVGMKNSHSSPTVSNCIFAGNYITNPYIQSGAGMSNSNSSPLVINCIFTGNNSYQGTGVISNLASSPTIMNCTIVGNTNYYGVGGVHNRQESNPTIINTILWDNGSEMNTDNNSAPSIHHCCIQGGYSGEDIIDDDPQFENQQEGDLRIKPTSPCVDSGYIHIELKSDIRGLPRPYGAGVDMGAYEWSNLSPDIVAALLGLAPVNAIMDANSDGLLDAADLSRD